MNRNQVLTYFIIVIISFVVISLLVVGFLIKHTYDECMIDYNLAFETYEKNYSILCEKINSIDSKNLELDSKIKELELIVNSEKKPYDSSYIIEANEAIIEAKTSRKDNLSKEDYLIEKTEYSIVNVGRIKADTNELIQTNANIEMLNDVQVPDYSQFITLLDYAKLDLETSIARMEQVTNPSEAFILSRMQNIKEDIGITDMVALTEDTDPENYINKKGWYYSKVIFEHCEVDNYAIDNGICTLAETGNPAGGCIEAFKTYQEAENRNAYLTSLEGTIICPGDRIVCGTLVIRVSDDLKASMQKELLKTIEAEMIRLEGEEHIQIPDSLLQLSRKVSHIEVTNDDGPCEDTSPEYVDRYAEAIRVAEQFARDAEAQGYGVSRNYVRGNMQCLMVYYDYGYLFNESEATYGVLNANIDWFHMAELCLKEHYEDYDGIVSRENCEMNLRLWEFTDEEIEYAINNSNYVWTDEPR